MGRECGQKKENVGVEVRETDMTEGETNGMTVLISHAHADKKCVTTRIQ